MRVTIATLLLVPLLASCGKVEPAADFNVSVKTRYFVLHLNGDKAAVEETARFADAFVDYVDRELFPVTFEFPLDMYVFPDRSTYEGYLASRFSVTNAPHFGIYLPEAKALFTYAFAGTGSIAHDILEAIIPSSVPSSPPWFPAGVATFFEKFYGYYEDDGRLNLVLGYQNPWRLHAIEPSLLQTDLADTLNMSDPANEIRQCEARQVAMFLWREKRFQRCVSLVREQQKGGYETFVEAAFEAPLADIVPRWREYLDDVYVRRQRSYQLPPSQVFPGKFTFDEFMEEFVVGAPPAADDLSSGPQAPTLLDVDNAATTEENR